MAQRGGQTDVRRENLPILQDFIPYQEREREQPTNHGILWRFTNLASKQEIAKFFYGVLHQSLLNVICAMPAYPMGKMGNCPGPRAQGGPALAEGVIEN